MKKVFLWIIILIATIILLAIVFGKPYKPYPIGSNEPAHDYFRCEGLPVPLIIKSYCLGTVHQYPVFDPPPIF